MLTVIARETGEHTVLQYLYKNGEDGTNKLFECLGGQTVGEIFEKQDNDETYIGNAEDIEWWAQIIQDMNWIEDALNRLKTDLSFTLTAEEFLEVMEEVEKNAVFEQVKDPEYMRAAAWAIIQRTREDHDLPEDEEAQMTPLEREALSESLNFGPITNDRELYLSYGEAFGVGDFEDGAQQPPNPHVHYVTYAVWHGEVVDAMFSSEEDPEYWKEKHPKIPYSEVDFREFEITLWEPFHR